MNVSSINFLERCRARTRRKFKRSSSARKFKADPVPTPIEVSWRRLPISIRTAMPANSRMIVRRPKHQTDPGRGYCEQVRVPGIADFDLFSLFRGASFDINDKNKTVTKTKVYASQGDESMYTREALRQRRELRYAKSMVEILDRVWDLVCIREVIAKPSRISGHNDLYYEFVDKDRYLAFHARIMRALYGDSLDKSEIDCDSIGNEVHRTTLKMFINRIIKTHSV